MAASDTTYYSNQTGSNGDTVVKTYPKAQNIYFVRIPYTLGGSEAATDTFNIYRARIGWKLIPELSKVIHDDGGTTLTLDIGDAADADRYANGVDLATAAGVEQFCDPAIPDAVPNPYAIEEANRDIVGTYATAASPTSDADVVIVLAFDIDTGDLAGL